MKRIKIILSTLVFALAITTTGCSFNSKSNQNQNNQVGQTEQQQKPEHIISSSIQDDSFIPENLTELNSEELVKTLTNLGYRALRTEENAKAGKLIKSYFEKIGLEPYKDNSYYHQFYAKAKNSYFKDGTTEVDFIFEADGTLENIVGKIKGEDSYKAIIVSAHFDTFPTTKGVIDNTAGTTALLEVAKNISNELKGKTFPVDIIFIAFNAEELGLLGSKAFYTDVSKDYKEFYNINIDSAGLKNDPLAYKNSHAKSEQLYKDFEAYVDKYDIHKGDTDYMDLGTSDNASFQDNGKAAIALGDTAAYELLHTPKDDNLDLVDYVELNNLIKAVSEFILESNGKMY